MRTHLICRLEWRSPRMDSSVVCSEVWTCFYGETINSLGSSGGLYFISVSISSIAHAAYWLLCRFAVENELHEIRALLQTALFFEAIKRGDDKYVKQHMQSVDILAIRDRNGYSPLLVACGYGNEHVVKLLLEAGAGIPNNSIRKDFEGKI